MIGEQVKRARMLRGLTQEGVARLAGVPRKQYWKLEHDKLVTIETFRRVVTALEMRVVRLGSVDVIPGNLDHARVLGVAETALDAIRELVTVLHATRSAEDGAPSPDEVLATGTAARPILTPDHPTVKMLQQLIDQLAGANPRTRARS